MTAHPIDTEALRARAEHVYRHGGPANAVESLAANVPEILGRLAAAEHRATRAEAQSAVRGRAVVIYRDRAREAEAERDWNLRSSRLAKEERIKANARADRAEAGVEAAQEEAWEECAAMAAHHGDFDGSRARWLSSINPYSVTEKETA